MVSSLVGEFCIALYNSQSRIRVASNLDLETQSPKSILFNLQYDIKRGKIFHHHSNTGVRTNWFCPVPLWQGVRISLCDIITPPGSHISSPVFLRLTRFQCCNTWKVRWERRAWTPRASKLIPNQSVQGQPNSAGCAGFTPESSMRDSWSLKQFRAMVSHLYPPPPFFRLCHIFPSVICGECHPHFHATLAQVSFIPPLSRKICKAANQILCMEQNFWTL